MGDSKKKKGWFGQFMSTLSGKPSEQAKERGQPQGLYAPERKESVDLSFVQSFTTSGGKFLYCENEEEALTYLKSITTESGLEVISCYDKNLQSILSKAELSYTENATASDDAFCCGCEFLVSFNGGIMISANQTKGKKLADLPEIFIIISQTSQIVENLRSALTGIRVKYKGDIPSQITTIKGPIKESGTMENTDGQFSNKDIYLLLLEDQL